MTFTSIGNRQGLRRDEEERKKGSRQWESCDGNFRSGCRMNFVCFSFTFSTRINFVVSTFAYLSRSECFSHSSYTSRVYSGHYKNGFLIERSMRGWGVKE